jgi:NAD(P)-dependent dehydrogenase (short-subunit alcohol dehydrogenase family)
VGAVPPVAPLFRLDGKVALVTGGSRGLGRTIAAALAAAGARVAITARRAAWLDETVAAFEASGHDVLAHTADITDAAARDRVVDAILGRWGRLDILVNNAGTTWGAPSVAHPEDRWRSVIETNLTAAFALTQRFAREVIDRDQPATSPTHIGPVPVRGKVINVSSIMAARGTDPRVVTAAAYTASKGAVEALTRALAVEWAPHGITVNAVAPGFFPTRLSEGVVGQHEEALVSRVPLGRLGSERDLAGVAVFLAAPASDYVTGQVLALDGGATAW